VSPRPTANIASGPLPSTSTRWREGSRLSGALLVPTSCWQEALWYGQQGEQMQATFADTEPLKQQGEGTVRISAAEWREIVMKTNSAKIDQLRQVLRLELLRLARHEEDLAAAEGAEVPYWAPCPPSVLGHRTAAAALRADADRITSPELELLSA
jgi:hypothetical protein